MRNEPIIMLNDRALLHARGYCSGCSTTFSDSSEREATAPVNTTAGITNNRRISNAWTLQVHANQLMALLTLDAHAGETFGQEQRFTISRIAADLNVSETESNGLAVVLRKLLERLKHALEIARSTSWMLLRYYRVAWETFWNDQEDPKISPSYFKESYILFGKVHSNNDDLCFYKYLDDLNSNSSSQSYPPLPGAKDLPQQLEVGETTTVRVIIYPTTHVIRMNTKHRVERVRGSNKKKRTTTTRPMHNDHPPGRSASSSCRHSVDASEETPNYFFSLPAQGGRFARRLVHYARQMGQF